MFRLFEKGGHRVGGKIWIIVYWMDFKLRRVFCVFFLNHVSNLFTFENVWINNKKFGLNWKEGRHFCNKHVKLSERNFYSHFYILFCFIDILTLTLASFSSSMLRHDLSLLWTGNLHTMIRVHFSELRKIYKYKYHLKVPAESFFFLLHAKLLIPT